MRSIVRSIIQSDIKKNKNKKRRRSNIPNIGIYLIAASDGRYYVYAAKPS
jgi:hypothetical protein